jgi:hypothetical protein
MRLLGAILVAVLVAVLATGCSVGVAASQPPATSEANLLVSEGGMLRPIDNGGRVGLKSGWATVKLWPSPQDMDPNLEVAVFDAAGNVVSADVWVVYEMMDMDHGIDESRATFREGLHRMHLSFGMQGSWKLVVHIARAGLEESVVLVLPWIGL